MNISLTPFNLKLASPTNYFSRNNTSSNNNYGNTKLAPLAQDVVSFSGKAKKAVVEEPDGNVSKAKSLDESDKSAKIPYQVGRDINSECQEDLKKLKADLKKALKNVTESDANPDLPVLRGELGIHGRVKKAESILQKVSPRKLRQKEEIFKINYH